MIETTIENAEKVLKVVDVGLCGGVGSPVAGKCCIVAAKRLACGLSHGDEIEGLPIGYAVRSFEIALNDCGWSSKKARAKGMRRLSVAEWGSNEINQQEFSKLLALKTIQKLLPRLFRLVAEHQIEPHKSKMIEAAKNCEMSTGLNAAVAARYDAAAAAAAAVAVAARYAAAAARYAAAAARYDAAAAAAVAARYAAADDRDDAAAAAAVAARYDAAVAARYAAAAARYVDDAAAAADDRDEWLSLSAEICVEVLIELKSPGTEWLHLCK